MARSTYVERQAAIAMLAYGLLCGVGVTLAFFGIVWLPFSAAGIGIVVVIRYLASKGRRLDFERWFVGAVGESQVSRALKELESLGYTVIEDVDKGHGNVDHVVVGPTGVFAIETKNRGGRVVAAQGRLVDPWDEKGVRQAMHEAMWVRDRVAVRFVKALVVYPSAKVEPDVIQLPRVTVLSLARLNAEITSQPASLSADEILRVTMALSA